MDPDLHAYLLQILGELREAFDAYIEAATLEDCELQISRVRGSIEELEQTLSLLKP